MTAGAKRRDEMVAVDAVDRLLAGRIDSATTTASASLKQVQKSSNRIVQSRVAVRLDDGDDPPLVDFARRLQHRRDLDRMVAVIVDDASTPFQSPVVVKRRFTPPKPASALRMASSGRRARRATAIAAVAF